jgi:GAF domain-containing protein
VPAQPRTALDKPEIRDTVIEKNFRRTQKMTDYEALIAQADALTNGVPHRISNLANVSALIFDAMDDLNWAGFYLLEGETLVLGPFQGRPACIEIKIGRGVCGTAAAQRRTLVVPDVHEFKGHIACDSCSRSENVVPLIKDGAVIGVLDIESPEPDRFSPDDKEGIELVAGTIVRYAF